MAINAYINTLQASGDYEVIYPQTVVENIVDIQDNYYTKQETLQSNTAALFELGENAVPDNILNILSASALYKTITPTQQLGSLTEGSIIYLNENGSPVPFYVAKQNYEPDYNTNRTLVVRKDVEQQGVWSSVNSATYGGSTIDNWFNQTYLQTLDSDVQEAIGTTNIPYTPSIGDPTLQRIDKKIFALSLTEYGGTPDQNEGNVLGTVLPTASLIKNANPTWTRTIRRSIAAAYTVSSSAYGWAVLTTKNYYQPAFTLPSTFPAYLDEPTTGLFDIQNNLLMTLPSGGGTGFAQIETGSYVGTGTYGQNNPNTLTFGFVPIFFVVMKRSSSNSQMPNQSSYAQQVSGQFYAIRNAKLLGCTAQNPGNSGMTAPFIQIEWMDSSAKWWVPNSNNAADQFNESGTTYDYIVIG